MSPASGTSCALGCNLYTLPVLHEFCTCPDCGVTYMWTGKLWKRLPRTIVYETA